MKLKLLYPPLETNEREQQRKVVGNVKDVVKSILQKEGEIAVADDMADVVKSISINKGEITESDVLVDVADVDVVSK